jgi:hypothetical protein
MIDDLHAIDQSQNVAHPMLRTRRFIAKRQFLHTFLSPSFAFQLQAGQLPTRGKSPPTFLPSFAVGT